MNDQSTPIDEAPAHGIPRPDDPDYQDSLHDTQVTQRLADYADRWAGYREEDRTIFLMLLKEAYEGIRPDNDWAMDIC